MKFVGGPLDGFEQPSESFPDDPYLLFELAQTPGLFAIYEVQDNELIYKKTIDREKLNS